MLLLSFVVFLYSMLLIFSLFKVCFILNFTFCFNRAFCGKKTHKNCQEYQTAEAVVHGWRVLATNWIQVFWEQLH